MPHLKPKPPKTTTPAELRKFGLLVGGAFLALAALTFWRAKPAAIWGTFGALGATLFLIGLAEPESLDGVYRGWMRFALSLSKVTTPIFIGVIYFVVLTPMGLVMRAFGRRPLARAAPGKSAWITRAAGDRASSLERQF